MVLNSPSKANWRDVDGKETVIVDRFGHIVQVVNQSQPALNG